MNFFTIKRLQAENGLSTMQSIIDNGYAWKNCGELARKAMAHLDSGACMLPKIIHRDYYGNMIPARQMQKPDEFGSYQKCAEYWKTFLTLNPKQ